MTLDSFRSRFRRRHALLVIPLAGVMFAVTVFGPASTASAVAGDRTVYKDCSFVGYSWGKVCLAKSSHYTSFDNYLHMDLTATLKDTAEDGHYVMLQRDLTWKGDGWVTIMKTGGTYTEDNYWAFGSPDLVHLRLQRTGTWDTYTLPDIKAPLGEYPLHGYAP